MKELSFDMLDFDYGDDWTEKIDDVKKKMEPVFEQFEVYLKGRKLKKKTVQKKVQFVAFFLFEFLYIYGDVENISEVDEDIIRTFLGNWYIRKFMNPNMTEIRGFLNAIADFYTFLHKNDLMYSTDTIKEVCKDKKWFERRLETYFRVNGAAFENWIDEYNYDFM